MLRLLNEKRSKNQRNWKGKPEISGFSAALCWILKLHHDAYPTKERNTVPHGRNKNIHATLR